MAGVSQVCQLGLGVTPFPHTESPHPVPHFLSLSFAVSWARSVKCVCVVGGGIPAGVAPNRGPVGFN